MQLKYDQGGQPYYTEGREEIHCFEVYGEDRNAFLDQFIPYLESKPDDQWIDVIFANKDVSKRCVIFHFLGFVGCDYPNSKYGSNNLDWYDSAICFIQKAGCLVNDGNSDDYPQSTPKARSIAFLKNLRAGLEKSPMELMDDYFSDHPVVSKSP